MAGQVQETGGPPLAPLEDQPLHEFARKAYLDYAMYVILDRALPHIADGLKPVQRRIIYAMWELGLRSTAKAKKSARTVGDVLGKFHPHGDVPCYEAMVSIAQPFSCRYPLVHGQGNWGSRDDPKSFAAMRYTEARLSMYADALLSELKQGTVDWVPNFDGSLQEPRCLPARLPSILLNGATGIAVGMSTDIPPHHCGEVVDAALHLLDHPDATVKDVCQWVKGPDFPGGADIITPTAELVAMYEKGQGSVRMRAIYHEEAGNIVIDALPHQASGAKILAQIAQQMQNKSLALISDVRDESDHQCPIRLVVVPGAHQVDISALMAHLFATTDLERHYRVNMNVIGLDGRPAVKNLITILKEWLTFRQRSVVRRLTHRCEKVTQRLHILSGLLIAHVHIDQVIAIIRESDAPKVALMRTLNMTDSQADAILEMRLRQLAKLEAIKLQQEHDTLQTEKAQLDHYLHCSDALRGLMRQELLADKSRFGDARRCRVVVRQQAKVLATQDRVAVEPVTVILSENGWIRAAKGHDIDPTTLRYKSGDALRMSVRSYSNQSVVVLDSFGRTYGIAIAALPSARTQGEPLTKYLCPPEGATFIAIMAGEITQRYLLVSDQAYGFVGTLSGWCTKNRQGRSVMKLPTNGRVLPPIPVPDVSQQTHTSKADAPLCWVAVVTRRGRLLCFPLDSLPMRVQGKGNKLIDLQKPALKSGPAKGEGALQATIDGVVACTVFTQGQSLRILAGRRHFRLLPKDIEAYKGKRGRSGHALPRGFQRVDAIDVYGDTK